MAQSDDIRKQQIGQRKKFVLAWNSTMIRIWKERILKLGIIGTGRLFASPYPLMPVADSDYIEITEQQRFLEYGIWQDLGVGRETPHGTGFQGETKVRQRRKWFSPKYYGSVMALKEFLAESIGEEFVAVAAAALSTDKLKKQTNFYRRKGY